MRKSKVSFKPSIRLAHILGLLKGDGSAYIQKQWRNKSFVGNRYVLSFCSKDKELAELLTRELKEQRLNVWLYSGLGGVRKRVIWYVKANNKKFVTFYQGLTPEKLKFIVNHSNDRKCAFLKGFFEAEGTYQVIQRRGTREYRVWLTNTDYELLLQAKEFIEDLGFNPRIFSFKNKNGWKLMHRVNLQRNDEAQRFIELIHPVVKNSPKLYCSKGVKNGR